MFKQTTTIILLVLLFPALAFSQATERTQFNMEIPSGSLTLKKAQQIALSAAPSIKQATAHIEAAKAVVDQTRSALKPNLSANLGFHYQDSTIQPDWAPEVRVSDSFHIASAGVSTNWLLFDGFATRARVAAAKHQVEASEQTRNEVRRILAEAVASAFYQAQLAVESMLIAQQNQIFNRTLEDEADKRWQAGTIPEAEKLNFSVRALRAETDYLTANQSFKLVTTILAELLALDTAKLPAELYPVASKENVSEQTIPTYQTEFTYAVEHRPDLQSTEASIAAMQAEKKGLKRNYLPKLFFNAGLDYNKLTELSTVDQEEHDAYAGLNLTWDIYKGGKRSAQIKSMEQNIRALSNNRQRQLLAIQSSIHQAIFTAEATQAMYQRQQQSLVLTAKIRTHTEKAYRAGVANLTRLNEAQTDLVRAAGAEAASRINYLLALQQLEAASGRILEN